MIRTNSMGLGQTTRDKVDKPRQKGDSVLVKCEATEILYCTDAMQLWKSILGTARGSKLLTALSHPMQVDKNQAQRLLNACLTGWTVRRLRSRLTMAIFWIEIAKVCNAPSQENAMYAGMWRYGECE